MKALPQLFDSIVFIASIPFLGCLKNVRPIRGRYADLIDFAPGAAGAADAGCHFLLQAESFSGNTWGVRRTINYEAATQEGILWTKTRQATT